MIPVDLRHYNPKQNSLGNIILPIYIEIRKDESEMESAGKLFTALKEHKELNYCNVTNFGYDKIPQMIRQFGLKQFFKNIKNKNKYCVGAIISHLGRLNYEKYNKANFKINDVIFLPNHQPLTPFSINIVEFNGNTNIIICYYKSQIPTEVIKNIEIGLKKL